MSDHLRMNGHGTMYDRRDIKSLRDDIVVVGESVKTIATATAANTSALATITNIVLEIKQRGAPSPLHYAAIAACAAAFGAAAALLVH